MDGYVEVDAAFYTAPAHLIGLEVRVRSDERLVRIYHQGRAVRVHVKRAPGRWATNPEDRPDHKPARQQAVYRRRRGPGEHADGAADDGEHDRLGEELRPDLVLRRTQGAGSMGWAIMIPVEAWAGGIASATLIGAVAGLMPAVRASRMPPTAALRTV